MRARKWLGAPALAAFFVLQSGCLGMAMDESGAEERGRNATKDENYKVITITPQVITDLAKHADLIHADGDPNGGQPAKPYTIAPFDVLQVTVWEHPELTTPAGPTGFMLPSAMGAAAGAAGITSSAVSPAGSPNGIAVDANGTIFYPHVGVLEVGGKTLAEVRALLTDKLSRVIVSPQLDVRISAFRGKRVQVTGEVVTPTAMPLTDVPLRVQDAIANAGGFTPESGSPVAPMGIGADPANVTLSRGGRTYRLNLLALYEQGDMSQNWLLQDGDVINVGDRGRNRVFVLGEVHNQQAKLMVRRRMTLAEALSDSQLDQTFSNAGKIYVIRGDLRAPTIFRLDASSADAMILATQFQLHPLDVVFVSTYELVRWNRLMAQILPTVQLLYEGVVGAGVVNTITKTK